MRINQGQHVLREQKPVLALPVLIALCVVGAALVLTSLFVYLGAPADPPTPGQTYRLPS